MLELFVFILIVVFLFCFRVLKKNRKNDFTVSYAKKWKAAIDKTCLLWQISYRLDSTAKFLSRKEPFLLQKKSSPYLTNSDSLLDIGRTMRNVFSGDKHDVLATSKSISLKANKHSNQ